MAITFNNTVYPAGYVGEDDGQPAAGFGIDAASTGPITINGMVTKVGDVVTATGVLPGGDDTGITATTNTLVVTQFDSPSMILFSIQGQGAAAGQPFRIVLSNTNLTQTGASQTRFNGAQDPALVNGTAGDAYTPAPPVCFTTGTAIRVVRGEVEVDVAVEALLVGDLAVTAAGKHRPIRWIGSRVTHCRRHPEPHNVMPVRIAAHAFAENRPARDLRVSPGHALCLDVCGEVLVPAAALVNGSTIAQEEVDRVTYWHVELDGGHDVLLAENMPAESYLDMGNRGFFAATTATDGGVIDLAALPDAEAAQRSHADFCRPFHAAGPVVEAVRAQLGRRAARLAAPVAATAAVA